MQRTKMRWAPTLALLFPLGGACSAGGSRTFPPSASGGSGGTPTYETGGASTAAGGTGQASGGSSAVRDRSLFNWPEANPDGSAPLLCKAGHYVGTYSCNVTGPNGFGTDGGAYPLTGPVDLTLTQSQNGEFLDVSGGTLK